jgi:cytochrome c oxidase cbb3-type subunit 3
MDVYKTVREGVPAKGMLAWERQLRPAELMAVSSFVGTMLGSEPPNPKAPQGDRLVRQEPALSEEVEVATDEAAIETQAEPAAS